MDTSNRILIIFGAHTYHATAKIQGGILRPKKAPGVFFHVRYRKRPVGEGFEVFKIVGEKFRATNQMQVKVLPQTGGRYV